MDDSTQAPAPVPSPASEFAAPASDDSVVPGGDGPFFDAAAIQRGLLAWLGIITAGGIACTLLGHAEGAVLFAGAGAFALAQASDAAAVLERYRAFVHEQFPARSLHGVMFRGIVRALVPVSGALFYAAFAAFAWTGDAAPHRVAAWWCAAAALVSLALVARPVADAVTRVLFRGPVGRTRRLTARLVVLALLMPVPAGILSGSLMDRVRDSGTVLADPASLTAQLLGELAIAFAGVGWLVRRDGRRTLERLGLTAMRPGDWLVVVAGVLGLIALNGGTEWLEHHAFPLLWARDRDTTQLIAGHMGLAASLLLGVSAGAGEEIAVRGALQPRLGLLLSSLLFATGHVQYTWFGMATIALLGLALGGIRARTNTTTAIVVHSLYDIFAALTANT